MENVFYIKEGDLLPPFKATLTDDDGPVDLTTATMVKLRLKLRETEDPVVEYTCVVTDADKGKITYEWEDGDTDVVGDYHLEVKVTFPGKDYTFPNKGSKRMEITPKLV